MNSLFSRMLFKTTPRAATAAPDGTKSFEFDSNAGADGNFILTNPDKTVRYFGGNARPGTPVSGVRAVKTLTSNNTNVADDVAATVTLTSDNTNVANGATVTLGAKTYTFKTALTPTEGEVLIGADADGSLLNLIRAINHTGTPNTDYKCAAAHPTVSAASAVTSHAFLITARTAGTAGNALASTETSAHLSFGSASLTGGAAAVTVTIGAKTYTFRTALTPLEGEVLIGSDADGSLLNLIRAINHTGTPNTHYKCLNRHPDFSAAASVTSHAFAITARTVGLAATSLTTTETSSTLSWANTTAGVDGTPASDGDMLYDATHFYVAHGNLTTASTSGWFAHSATAI